MIRPMRCCYHIQSHRSPNQLLRLIQQIKRMSPDSVVHVSHDEKGVRLDTSALRGLPEVVVQFHRGGYGDFSHIDRYLAAVDWLVANAVRVDWLINLTGQDYPLRPLAASEAELVNSGADGFMEYWPAYGPQSHWPARLVRSRYRFRHHRLARLPSRAQRLLRPVQALNWIQPLVRVHVAYGLAIGRRVRPAFGTGTELTLYGGSAYSSLSWPAVAYLRDYLRARPDVVAYFRRTLAPEEVVFQTVLVSSGRFRLVPDCKRYFDFSQSRLNHPKLLTTEDLPRALASGAHFGRKFDADAHPEVVDALDAHLLRTAMPA
jgi:hypothetical protein